MKGNDDMIMNGNFVDADDLARLHKPADAGDAEALYKLGMRHFRREGVCEDVRVRHDCHTKLPQ